MFCPRLKITPPRLLTKLRGGPFKQYSLFWRKISQFVIFHLSLSWNERWGNLPQNSAVVKMAASPVFPEEELEGEQSHSEECPGTFHCGVLTYFTRKLSFIPKKDCGFIKNLRHLALFMVPLKAAITAPQCSIWLSNMSCVLCMTPALCYWLWLTFLFFSISPHILTLSSDKQVVFRVEGKDSTSKSRSIKSRGNISGGPQSLLGTLENMVLKVN